MVATRAETGHSKPRILKDEVAAAPVKAVKKKAAGAAKKATSAAKTAKAKATTTKAKAGTKTTKANTSKPRAKQEAAAKVTKSTATKKKATTPTKKAATPKTKKATPKAASASKAAAAKAEPKMELDDAEPSALDSAMETAKGLLLKAQGAITGSTGKKAAGTAKIRGTEGGKKAAPKKAKA